jgi:hypothetical protein
VNNRDSGSLISSSEIDFQWSGYTELFVSAKGVFSSVKNRKGFFWLLLRSIIDLPTSAQEMMK